MTDPTETSSVASLCCVIAGAVVVVTVSELKLIALKLPSVSVRFVVAVVLVAGVVREVIIEQSIGVNVTASGSLSESVEASLFLPVVLGLVASVFEAVPFTAGVLSPSFDDKP
jgi:hypothetical protein